MQNFNLINTALAHTAENGDINSFGAHHGFGIMGDFGWTGMFVGWTIMILFWVLVVLAIVALIKYINRVGYGGNDSNRNDNSHNTKSNEKIYICTECGYEYKEKEWAIKCQKWCAEHKSCNMDIIKHGTPLKN